MIGKQFVKKSKYRNTKIEIDGIKFDSIRESKHYLLLRERQKLGEISELELQKRFELQPSFKMGTTTIRPITYVADFTYQEKGKLVVVDVKGFSNQLYLLKKKLFMFKYGIEIMEV